MNRWLHEVSRLIEVALGNPDSLAKLILLSLGAIAAFVAILGRAGEMMKVTKPGERAVAVFSSSAGLFVLAWAAFNLHVAPKVSSSGVRATIVVVLAILVLCAVSVPLVCYVQKASYVRGLVSVLVSVVGTMLAIVLMTYVLEAVWLAKSKISPKPINSKSYPLSDFFMK